MEVLFLILNYKTYRNTICLTNELLSFKTTLDYGILIIDNCSSNESYQQLKKTYDNNNKVEVIATNENGGYAKGNNFGLRHAKKEYVCLINNDVHFSAKVIEHLVKQYEELPNVGIISPVQLLPGHVKPKFKETQILRIPSFRDDFLSYLFFKVPIHEYKENTDIRGVQKVEIIQGAFLFIRYSKFEEVGFFDESTFLFGEERILAKKIKEAGLSNYIILDEYYIHAHSITISQFASDRKKAEYRYKGKKAYIKKYEKFPLVKCSLLTIAYRVNQAILFFHVCIKRIKKRTHILR